MNKHITNKFACSPSFLGRIRGLAFIALFIVTAVPAAAITISGTVYNDGNGGNISGTAISSIQGSQLYVYLIDNSNTIVDRSAVSASSFTYSLTGNANVNYNVSLSSAFYSVGTGNPVLGLPTSWAPTAEGTTTAGDGTPDYSVAINSSANLTINFAIDARPTGFGFYYATPTYDASGRVTFPAGAFTGSDPEDGTYTPGFFGRDIDLYQGVGGQLYYDGSLITFTSAATATRIANFDVSKLRFQMQAGSTHQFAFSTVDNAGVPEFVPNSITLPGTPLPIDITAFNASVKGQNNYLSWQTSKETNNKGFTIERSEDGYRFLNIATVPSQAKEGNSTGTLSYAFVDKDAAAGPATVYYYRIRQTDYSGAFKYTPVARVVNQKSTYEQLALAPNPSMGTVNLDMATGAGDEPVQLTVLNAMGNVVLTRSFEAAGGRLSTALDMSTHPAGTYYVQLTGSSTPKQVKSFVLLPH